MTLIEGAKRIIFVDHVYSTRSLEKIHILLTSRRNSCPYYINDIAVINNEIGRRRYQRQGTNDYHSNKLIIIGQALLLFPSQLLSEGECNEYISFDI